MRNSTKTTIFLGLFILLSILTLINGISNIKNRQEEKEEKEEELKFKEKCIKGLSVSLKMKESMGIGDRKISRFISDSDKRSGLREEEEEEEEVTKTIREDRMMEELEKEKEYLVVNRTVELLKGKKNLKGIIDRSSIAVVLFGGEIPTKILSRILKMEAKDKRDDSSVRLERIAGLQNRKNVVRSNNLGGDNSNNEILREEYRYGYKEFEEPRNGLGVPKLSDEGNPIPKENRKAVYLPSDYHDNPDTTITDESLSAVLEKVFFKKIIEISKKTENSYKENPEELIKELDFDNNRNTNDSKDLCKKWLRSENRLKETFLGDLRLPSCPCHYPSRIFYDDQIWDEFDMRNFRWRDVSGETERLDVYKPGAKYCIRSLLNRGGGTAAAQHCCYDIKRRLITRGSGAGTPNLISPEVSPILHERIDVLPWRLCKGDFSRFNKSRKPNNDNRCKENPNDYEYTRQIESTRHY